MRLLAGDARAGAGSPVGEGRRARGGPAGGDHGGEANRRVDPACATRWGWTAFELSLFPIEPDAIGIEAIVKVHGRTGVEMEALTAVSVAALTVYDMCKSVDREMTIGPIQLEEKTGGRRGTFRRAETPSVVAAPECGCGPGEGR